MTGEFSSKRLNEFMGTMLLCAAGILAVLIFVDRWSDVDIGFPSFWYTSRNFHVALLAVMCVAGWLSHRNASSLDSSRQATETVFGRVVVYSKPDCPLCDQALDILDEYSRLLPAVQKVDISSDAELEQKYAMSVPVVEIDGRIRFRGIVSAELLERMIEVQQRQRAAVDAAAENQHGRHS